MNCICFSLLKRFRNENMKASDEEGIRERLSAFSEVDANCSVINLETGTYYNNRRDEIFQMDQELLDFYRTLEGAELH